MHYANTYIIADHHYYNNFGNDPSYFMQVFNEVAFEWSKCGPENPCLDLRACGTRIFNNEDTIFYGDSSTEYYIARNYTRDQYLGEYIENGNRGNEWSGGYDFFIFVTGSDWDDSRLGLNTGRMGIRYNGYDGDRLCMIELWPFSLPSQLSHTLSHEIGHEGNGSHEASNTWCEDEIFGICIAQKYTTMHQYEHGLYAINSVGTFSREGYHGAGPDKNNAVTINNWIDRYTRTYW